MKRSKAVVSLLLAGVILQGSIVGAAEVIGGEKVIEVSNKKAIEGVPAEYEERFIERMNDYGEEDAREMLKYWIEDDKKTKKEFLERLEANNGYMSTNERRYIQDKYGHLTKKLEIAEGETRFVLHKGWSDKEEVKYPSTIRDLDIDRQPNITELEVPSTVRELAVKETNIKELTVKKGVLHAAWNNEEMTRLVLQRGVTAVAPRGYVVFSTRDGNAWYRKGIKMHMYISSTVTDITPRLVGCDLTSNLVIHAPKGSYAEEYAKEKGITYEEEPESSEIWGDKTIEEVKAEMEAEDRQLEEIERRAEALKKSRNRMYKKENVVKAKLAKGISNYVDGKETSITSYIIDNNNYVQLRDFADKIKDGAKPINIGWDNTKKAITVETDKRYTGGGVEKTPNESGYSEGIIRDIDIYIDGISEEVRPYVIENNTYYRLRDLCDIFNIEVEWDGDTKSVHVKTEETYTEVAGDKID